MTPAHQPQPAVIVGAGPAGASLAMLLAERGVPVTLVEAARDFQRQFRGEGLMPSGLAALEAMGCGA
ncbi:MAG: FAD-dependent oxidoreductase, partial [Cyanobacteria bacterium]|nr:FAD-dependent oxidoreductase [Cyanobacteriota bacterium]